jgi:hypothetical protein
MATRWRTTSCCYQPRKTTIQTVHHELLGCIQDGPIAHEQEQEQRLPDLLEPMASY